MTDYSLNIISVIQMIFLPTVFMLIMFNLWTGCRCPLQESGAGLLVEVRSHAGECAVAATLRLWGTWRTAMTRTAAWNPHQRLLRADRATYVPHSSRSVTSSLPESKWASCHWYKYTHTRPHTYTHSSCARSCDRFSTANLSSFNMLSLTPSSKQKNCV